MAKTKPIDLTPKYDFTSFREKMDEVVSPYQLGEVFGGMKVGSQELSQGGVYIKGAEERILIGAATAPLTGTGIFMGSDQATTIGYDFRVGNPLGNYVHWDASAGTLTIVGSITATAGTIGGFDIGSDYIRDAADSMGLASTVTGGDDVRFWAGDTFANRATADFRVTESGAVTASSMTITGGSVATTTLNKGVQSWTTNIVFSSSDSDTVAWTSGAIRMQDSTSYSIDAGNTGNMAAVTWIYLDIAVSLTVLQTTTTYSTAVGDGKFIVAMAKNVSAGDASVLPFGGGQPVINGDDQVSCSTLAAINANMGSITAGSLTINSGIASIASDGKAVFQDVDIGNRYITVAPGENIQDAINLVSSGGGIVVLTPGTHTVNYDITIPSGVYLYGVNRTTSIIDFNSNSNQIKIVGSGAYSTGTVSVSNGGTTVTGSSTNWDPNVTAGQYIMLAGIWYPIAVVTNDTTLTIGLPFADDDLSGATYIAATIIYDVRLKDFTVKNSATAAIKQQYGYINHFENLDIQTSAVGIDFDDNSGGELRNVNLVANNVQMTADNCHFATWVSFGGTDSQVGNGFTFTNVTDTKLDAFFVLNSAGDGFNFTSCSNMICSGMSVLESGGQGIEFVSGNSNIILMGCRIQDNASDGVKLTATSDHILLLNSNYKENGGYGVNIAASTCDENLIVGNIFDTNTSGAISDSGTDTVISGNVPDSVNPKFGFGGTGADGALAISSGTTSIDLGSASVLIKNYSSISITGTGDLAFTNPASSGTLIILKSRGGVTLTSSAAPMMDGSGLGASGGTGGFGSISPLINAGSSGGASSGSGASGGAGGAGLGSSTAPFTAGFYTKSTHLYTGAGGGSGGAGSAPGGYPGGAGGRGGGAIYIECGGAWNFTTSSGISVAGDNGTNGTDADGGGNDSGGGGGGAGGTFLAFYQSLTANSGTVTVSGGTGGTGGGGTSGGAGGNGSSGTSTGGAGGTGDTNSGGGGGGGGSAFGCSNGTAGTAGSSNNAGGGGGGASGFSLIGQYE